jgi:23S rRNA (uracil1939-C5)-methyltransferase
MERTPLNVGDFLEVTTEGLAYGGDAIARHEGLAIFVPFAAPKERIRVRITERKKNFARGVVDQVLEGSPTRREPHCQYFGACGGCQLQHITYDAQLAAKAGFVRDALERIGRIDWPHEIPIHHAAEFGYRARAQVKIDPKTGGVGFNRAASNVVCDIESCPILVPELDKALGALRATVATVPFAGRVQVEIAAGQSGVAFEPAPEGLPGGALQQTVRGEVYEFSPSTFFQGNTGLLEKMVEEAVGGASGNLAIDLYAGVGLFTIQLARAFKRVIGVENDQRSTGFARRNIATNQVTNVEFHKNDVEQWLNGIPKTGDTPVDVVLLNPPRTGAAGAIPRIVDVNPARVTYVSCDPPTLARDLRGLIESGYELSRVTAIDLFPQTYHIETIATLERR